MVDVCGGIGAARCGAPSVHVDPKSLSHDGVDRRRAGVASLFLFVASEFAGGPIGK